MVIYPAGGDLRIGAQPPIRRCVVVISIDCLSERSATYSRAAALMQGSLKRPMSGAVAEAREAMKDVKSKGEPAGARLRAIMAMLVAASFMLLSSCSKPPALAYPSAAVVKLYLQNYGSHSTREIATLTPSQVAKLQASLTLQPRPDAMMACFNPHHFFRFYDEKGTQIGELAVCFCCGGLEARPESSGELELTGNFFSLGTWSMNSARRGGPTVLVRSPENRLAVTPT